MFSLNPTCQHIVFGGCHDSGYLVNLDQFRHNSERARRITLLESTTMHKGFADLANLYNFQRARFDDVFRSEPLPEYMPPPPRTTPPPTVQTPSTSVPTPSTASAPSPALPVRSKTSTPPTMASPLLAKVNSVPSTAPATQTTFPSLKEAASAPSKKESGNWRSSDSWATVGKTGVANGTSLQLKIKSNKPKKKVVYYNQDDQRLDEPLPPRSREASDAIERRMDKVRPIVRLFAQRLIMSSLVKISATRGTSLGSVLPATTAGSSMSQSSVLPRKLPCSTRAGLSPARTRSAGISIAVSSPLSIRG